MDFGKILDEWDRRGSAKPREKKPEKAAEAQAPGASSKPEELKARRRLPPAESEKFLPKKTAKEPDGRDYLKRWLLRNAVPDPNERETDVALEDAGVAGQAATERIRRMRPQASLDLHGKTKSEAGQAIDSFIADAQRQGFEKVLIIHGKGLHSEAEPVLAIHVRKVLEKNPLVGAFGPAAKDSGGRGATWARIRSADYFSR
ncbi:MAG: Smr/MutS family protein [Spirochaetia bacterium]|jgi:DNA-nicking Smr family endonuclease|nr:Smr/MutS family protein [Spirochaetia bacterium]